MHLLFSAGLAFLRTNDIIARLDSSGQDILELSRLVSIVVEETPGVDQAEEHLWQVVLEGYGSFLSCGAIRRSSLFCLPHRSFTRVDEAALT